jgi:hypothetical protein
VWLVHRLTLATKFSLVDIIGIFARNVNAHADNAG